MLEYHVDNGSLWHFDGLLSHEIASFGNRTRVIMMMMNFLAHVGREVDFEGGWNAQGHGAFSDL